MIIDTNKFKYKVNDIFWIMNNNNPQKIHIDKISLSYRIDFFNKESLYIEYYTNNSKYYTEEMLDKLARTKEELCKQIFKTDE